MSGKTYVGNSSSKSVRPKKIYAGNGSNLSKAVKVVYVGNSSGKSVEVWRNSTLPDTYQKVEYIYNNGLTQYIDTGIKPNSDTETIIDFLLPQSNLGGIFGVQDWFGSSSNNSYMLGAKYDAVYFEYGNVSSTAHERTTASISYNTKYRVTFNEGGKFYLDNSLVDTKTVTFSSISKNILLFKYYYRYNSSGSFEVKSGCSLYVYHFQIKQGNSLVRDMYPCYLKSNSQTVGMYDLIGGQFYANSGTGIFYKGPDID